MQALPDESGSEDEFDGYLEPEDGPQILRASDCHVDSGFTTVYPALSQASPMDSQLSPEHEVESPLCSISPTQMEISSRSHSPSVSATASTSTQETSPALPATVTPLSPPQLTVSLHELWCI